MLNNFIALNNLDLLIVGVVIAATCVLGFVVYFSNRHNITNRNFLLFSLVTALWGVINYFSYKFVEPYILLWLFRFLMFFALLQAFYLYRFLVVFPEKVYYFSTFHKYIVIPAVAITSILIFSPYVFSGIIGNPTLGEVAIVKKEWGLIIFAIIAIGLVIRAFYVLITKIKQSRDRLEKRTFRIILTGLITMFTLIIFFNLVLSTIFSNPKFIPLGALFTFPFILFTSYAIIKQRLFNVKVAATAVLVFVLSVILIIEVIFSETIILIIFRGCVFFLVLVFGINLIRSVIKEVEQREKLEILKSELEETNFNLGKANEKLKGLDKLKTEFVSLASHQLRSPLTAIKGYASMLMDGDYGEMSKEAKEAIDRMYQSSKNLTIVVEDLLNVTKIESGGMKFEMAPFDLSEVVEDEAKDFSITAEKKGLKLNFEKDNNSSFMVNGDKEKIRQIVINFIDNSVKYTKEGSVNVSVKNKDNKVVFCVKDTGMGMTEEVKESLFQKFARGDGARMNTTGSGLGLYLAKQIVEAHKGRVWVESDGPNKGSAFFMELDAIK